MKIPDVTAVWLHCPIPYEQQHVSDFGRMASFDCVLVTVTTESGLARLWRGEGRRGQCGQLRGVGERGET